VQFQGFVCKRGHPDLDLVGRRQDQRHRLGVDGADFGIGLRVRSLVVSPSLTFLTDVQLVQMKAKQASWRALAEREPAEHDLPSVSL
jgi:hypothetical protein